MPINKFILLITVFFISCETTKLAYASKTPVELSRLGIADIGRPNTQLDSLFPKLDSSFNAASIKYSNRFLAKETIHINEKMSCEKPDSLKIIELCAANQLDGIILTYVVPTLIINQLYYVITTEKHFECILYSKIYDKNGKMLYSVVHNSKQDTYEQIPTIYDVINLATGITYKKIYTTRQKK